MQETSGAMVDISARQALSDALRYWEPRRILYNGALAFVVAIAYFRNFPASRAGLSFSTVEVLFLLAVLANVAYCAAYIVDVGVQLSNQRALWLRARWGLLVTGIAFAAVLTHFLCTDIFGSPAP